MLLLWLVVVCIFRFSRRVKILKGVTELGTNVFWWSLALKGITIPNVTSYGQNTFFSCPDLANVYWGESTPATLSGFMFLSCSSLVSITIPETVTNLGMELFGDCSNLTSITITCDRKAISAGASQTGIIGNNPNTTNVDLKLHPSFKDDVTFNE